MGWLDRDLPGWSKQELDASLDLVRSLMMPNWDIHPEMISHTWVIDTKTGRPFPERSANFMENWGWSATNRPTSSQTTSPTLSRSSRTPASPAPGSRRPAALARAALPALAQGALRACRDVFQTEIPHYFRHLFTDDRSVAPRVEYATGLNTPNPECVVSIVGCTGDWFGGWDGLTPGTVDQFITADLKHGRLTEVIARGEPAILVCHWPGIYFNGEEVGFKIFQEIVSRLHDAYDHLLWMKLSEIARYWAARELTRIECPEPGLVAFDAPFACPQFTIKLELAAQVAQPTSRVRMKAGQTETALSPVSTPRKLAAGMFHLQDRTLIACFDLPRGSSRLYLG